LKLTVLVDNNSIIDRYFLAEPGLCFLLETEYKKVLFDLGYSDIFIKNAQKMKMDLTKIDTVVFSHGHNDHTGGLPHLISLYIEEALEKRGCIKPELICHRNTFNTKIIDDFIDIGTLIKEEKLNLHFNMKLTNEPLWITANLVYLGEIPRVTQFENKVPVGRVMEDNILKDDYLLDDSALVYKSKDGLVIITGCSHAGICNIIERAKAVCCDNRILDIIGGFHLLNPSKTQLDGTIEYFQKLNLRSIYASHCTDLSSKIALSEFFDIKEVGVGLELEYL